MGVGKTFPDAFGKALLAAGVELPKGGRAFVSVRNADKDAVLSIGRQLVDLGFELVATRGTYNTMQEAGIDCQYINKVTEGRPHIVDLIKNDEITFIVNTTDGRQAIEDSGEIRRTALQRRIVYTTTVSGAGAMCLVMQRDSLGDVYRLQDLHKELAL